MAIQGHGLTIKITHQATGLLYQEDTGRDIPRFEFHLPETIKAAGGYADQIKAGGSRPPACLSCLLKMIEVIVVICPALLVIVGKTGGQ